MDYLFEDHHVPVKEVKVVRLPPQHQLVMRYKTAFWLICVLLSYWLYIKIEGYKAVPSRLLTNLTSQVKTLSNGKHSAHGFSAQGICTMTSVSLQMFLDFRNIWYLKKNNLLGQGSP